MNISCEKWARFFHWSRDARCGAQIFCPDVKIQPINCDGGRNVFSSCVQAHHNVGVGVQPSSVRVKGAQDRLANIESSVS
jgi:hypothetical protein